MGIGKTTAIRSVCGDAIMESDVPNLDLEQHQKATTTVGVEFGEVNLGDGEKLEVYGCPGQERFEFVRSWVISLSQGIFIMVDVEHADAVGNTLHLIKEIGNHPAPGLTVILSARPTTPDKLTRFSAAIEAGGKDVLPILQVDVRDRQQMLDALQVLVSMLMFKDAHP